MATRYFPLTDSPQDVVIGLGLELGKTYTGQFQGLGRLLFGEFADSPAPTTVVNAIEDRQSMTIIPVAGMGVWVWLKSAKRGYLVVNDT